MDLRRIKAVLFVVVFLLVMAVAVNLLVDMQNTRKEVSVSDNAPVTVTPPAALTFEPAPAVTPAATTDPMLLVPTPEPTDILVATAPPAPTPTPTPEPTPTPVPTPTPIPVGETIGRGSFISDTGVPLNVRADWVATVEDADHVKVNVDVYLESYQINLIAVDRAVNVSVGDVYVSAGAPAVEWDQNVKIETLMASTQHLLYLPSGSGTYNFPLAVEYHFGGTYSKLDLPVIECGGSITLSR